MKNNIYIKFNNEWIDANSVFTFFAAAYSLAEEPVTEENFFDVCIQKGMAIKDIGNNPSVVDWLSIDKVAKACVRYHKIFPDLDVPTCLKRVRKIQKDMERMKNEA